jgi:hypothetical protein
MIEYVFTLPALPKDKYPAVMEAHMYVESPTGRALLDAMADGVKRAGGSAVELRKTEERIER